MSGKQVDDEHRCRLNGVKLAEVGESAELRERMRELRAMGPKGNPALEALKAKLDLRMESMRESDPGRFPAVMPDTNTSAASAHARSETRVQFQNNLTPIV